MKEVKFVNDIYLTESSRSALISKSKGADKYADGKGSRWTAKSDCTVASTVKDYNKIDMNTFWKEDKLTFDVKVKGKTSDYVVTISFNNILPKIQRKIQDNKNLLEFKCIYDALIQAINSGDVKISCTCPDYKYRLKYWNSQNGDEAGEHETRSSDKTNPEDTKGPACKHILAVLNNVEWLNKIASVINNYANYCKDNMEYNYSKYIFPKLYGMDYKKAVQMTLDDYDENGEIKGDLKSDEATINLANALGRERGKFKKGSNKNPAAKKKEESLQESLELNENFDIPDHLERHYNDHCKVRKKPWYMLFSDIGLNYTKEEYKKAAEDFVTKANKMYLKLKKSSNGLWHVQYYKYKQFKKDVYIFVAYYKDLNKPKRHIETYFLADVRYLMNEMSNTYTILDEEIPEEEINLTNFDDPYDLEACKNYEKEVINKFFKETESEENQENIENTEN